MTHLHVATGDAEHPVAWLDRDGIPNVGPYDGTEAVFSIQRHAEQCARQINDRRTAGRLCGTLAGFGDVTAVTPAY